MGKQYYIYILTNQRHTTLYTGVTNNLQRRVFEHRQKLVKGFTKKYNIDKLVYFEVAESPLSAISREKQIKAGSRSKKLAMIDTLNPQWRDLFNDII